MSPKSLQDALPWLTSFCLPLGLLISELLLISLVLPTDEVHLSWIDGYFALFPFPYPEKEGEERKWEIITIEKRSTFCCGALGDIGVHTK